ncbi:hypothetical protein FQN52_001226 [Onygenales sp. PD_12]|nr:hypothetical protein FQN52_001226 [Onygenales sp. PD_12]
MPPKPLTNPRPRNTDPSSGKQPTEAIKYEEKRKKGRSRTAASRSGPIPRVVSDVSIDDDAVYCWSCLFHHDGAPCPSDDPPMYQTSDPVMPGDTLTDEELSNVLRYGTVNPASLARPRPLSPNFPSFAPGVTTDKAIVVTDEAETSTPPSAEALPVADRQENGDIPSSSNTSSDGSGPRPNRKRARTGTTSVSNSVTLSDISNSPNKRARCDEGDQEAPSTEGPREKAAVELDPLYERYQTGEYVLLDIPPEAMSSGRKLGFRELLTAVTENELCLESLDNVHSLFPLEGQRTPRKWVAKLKSPGQAARVVRMARDIPFILRGHRVGVHACQSNDLSTQVYVSVSRTGDVTPDDLSFALRGIGITKAGSAQLWLTRQCWSGVFGGIYVAVFKQPLGAKYIDANVKSLSGHSPTFRIRFHAVKLLEPTCRICDDDNPNHVVTQCPLLMHIRGESDDDETRPEIAPLIFKRAGSVELGS